jgi:polynucleotide 5'-kinase involved in rRNA processing
MLNLKLTASWFIVAFKVPTIIVLAVRILKRFIIKMAVRSGLLLVHVLKNASRKTGCGSGSKNWLLPGCERSFANEHLPISKLLEENRIAYEAAWDYAQTFTDYRETGRSLLFLGDVGRGKTHLAAAILQEVLRQGYDGVLS